MFAALSPQTQEKKKASKQKVLSLFFVLKEDVDGRRFVANPTLGTRLESVLLSRNSAESCLTDGRSMERALRPTSLTERFISLLNLFGKNP